MALFQTATEYEQGMGCVPGVLDHRTRGRLTNRRRSAAVSHKLRGERRLAGEVEHSGDAALLRPATDDGEESDSTLETVVARDYVVHGERDGAPMSTDNGMERVRCDELLAPLTGRQRDLARLLMRGLTAADAARELGITPSAATQMLARIRKTLRLSGAVSA